MPAPIRLGIVAALPQEARILTHDYAEVLGSPPGRDGILLEVTGIGTASARAGAEHLLHAGANALLSWGVAAGLQPALAPGALVLPLAVSDAQGRRFHVDEAWHGRLLRALTGRVGANTGDITASDGLLRGPDDKRALYSRTGAVAADMESAVLADAARTAAVPFLAVRAVADPAAGIIPACVTRAADARGRVHIAGLLAAAAARPDQWLHLLRLARWFGAARRTLTQVARHGKPMLSAQ